MSGRRIYALGVYCKNEECGQWMLVMEFPKGGSKHFSPDEQEFTRRCFRCQRVAEYRVADLAPIPDTELEPSPGDPIQ